MSSPIVPIQGLTGPAGLTTSAPRDVPDDTGAFRAELSTHSHEMVSAAAGSPPAEVMDQISAAGRISRGLDESGYQVRFSEDSGGRVSVELADSEGKTVRGMKVSEALDIAVGKPLKQ